MAFSLSHFQNAQNVQVNNGQFLNIASNANTTINVNPVPISDPVTTIIWPHVASGAIFDSAEQFAVGKCHPGTRKKIIEDIISWIVDTDTTHPILWLHGPAGAGKSALAHTICELLKQQYPERYGGSFFFRSGHPDRENPLKLFTTLSYQLALHYPCLRSQINDAISHDPSLPTKSMEIQFLSLIAQPLLNSRNLLSHSPILIIDGLDECADAEGLDTQRNIVALIARFIVEYNLPLRVMIVSRPEYWIRDAFDTAPLPSITKSLCLRDDFNVYNDIKAFLIDGFEKIRLEHKRVMGSVDPPWPPSKVVKHLASEASGQYIYASTLLKFVGKSSRFINPQKQLEIIMSPGPHRATVFIEIDRLYITILSSYPQWEIMKRVLEGILVGANTTIIKVVLGVNAADLALVLDALSSLVDVKKPIELVDDPLFLEFQSIFGPASAGRDEINLHHRSFYEFIQDKTRSGAFHIDLQAVFNEIVEAFLDMFLRNLDQKYETDPHLFVNMDYHTYHNVMVSIIRKWGESHNISRLLRQPKRLDSIVDLRDAVDLAKQKAAHALSLCSTFKVAPILVYFTNVTHAVDLTINNLSLIPGIIDVISTIRRYRHFFHLLTAFDCDRLDLRSRETDLRYIHRRADSRIHDEQEEQRDFLIYHYLTLELNSGQIPEESYLFLKHNLVVQKSFDLCTRACFQNPHIRSILALMSDPEAWTRYLRTSPPGRVDFLITFLKWENRQLTNPWTLDLLKDHDESLQPKMEMTMRLIFEKGFLPYFKKCYRNQLCVFSKRNSTLVILDALPLPQGFHQEVEEIQDKSHPIHKLSFYYDTHWDFLHNELFGGKTDARKSSIITPSCYYPHLASYLLNALVRFLYGLNHPKFSIDTLRKDKFSYIPDCLPYAEPTFQNLEALRVIVYLYPQSTPTWDLPEGFWSLVAEFLQKYDRTVLSAEELDLFLLWLESPDHADITTYIKS